MFTKSSNTFYFLFILSSFFAFSQRHQSKTDSLLQVLEDTRDSISVYNQLSAHYSLRSPYYTKLYGEKALMLSQKRGYLKGQAEALENLGVVNWVQGYFEKALQYQRSAYQKYAELEDSRSLAESLNKIGLVFYWRDDYDSAAKYLESSIQLYRSVEDTVNLSRVLNNTAQVYDKMAHFEVSSMYFFEALKLDESINHIMEQRSSKFQRGPITDDEYFNEKLIAEQKQKVAFSKENNDTLNTIFNLTHLGNHFLTQGKNEKALGSFEELLLYTHENPDTSILWSTYINLASAHRRLKQEDEALTYFEKALKLQLAQKWWIKAAWTYILMGDANRRLENWTEAIRFYNQSIKINDELGYRLAVVRAQHRMFQCYAHMGDFEHARMCAEESLVRSKEILAKDFEKESLLLIAEAYGGLGNYKTAYSKHRAYASLKDSIDDLRYKSKIAQYQADYESSKKDAEISLLNNVSLLQRVKIKRGYQLAASLGVSLIILTILLAQQYRSYKLNKRNNREKGLLLGEIHHRVKNNLQIISSLLKLQSRQLEEGQAKSAVLEGRDRVKAMALIHQRLYQQDRFSAIQMDDYIRKLVESLAESYGFAEEDFELELDVSNIQLDVDTAVPLGLIINELVSNSFKHAFERDKANHLEVSLIEKDGELLLSVSDNGQGIPDGFTIEGATSFGLQLIYALTQELDGNIQFENGLGTKVGVGIKDYQIL